MNRKARLNYIHALSSQVERKKMYKAKKQWVVAGISFLVATGLGAVGSHLTTHAQVNNPTTNKVASGANNSQNSPASANNQQQSSAGAKNIKPLSASNVQNQANGLHSQLLLQHNNKPTTPQHHALNLGTTYTQSKHLLGSNEPEQPQGTQKATDTNWIYSRNGFLSDGQVTNNWKTQSNYRGLNWKYNSDVKAAEFTGGNLTDGSGFIMSAPSDIKSAKSIKFDNGTIASGNLSGSFAFSSSLYSLDLSGLDTSNVNDMLSCIGGNNNLISVNLGGNFSTKAAIDNKTVNGGLNGLAFMLNMDPNLSQITLGKNTILTTEVFQVNGNYVNKPTFTDGVDNVILNDGQAHQGTWILKSKLIISNASNQVNSDLNKVQELYNEDSNTTSLANTKAQVININNDKSDISKYIANIQTDKSNDVLYNKEATGTNSRTDDFDNNVSAADDAENEVASANSAYDNAYSADIAIKSILSASNSTNSSDFALALSGALTGTKFNSNSSLTPSENSVVSAVASDYNKWNSAASSATNASNAISSLTNSMPASASSNISSAINIAISSLFNSSSDNTEKSTIASVASSVASSYANSLVSSNSIESGNISYYGAVTSVANSYATSLAGSLTNVYESKSSESSDIKSLTSASADGKTTISGIASNVATGLINSLFNNDSSGSNSTLASVANSIANSYATSLTASNASSGSTTISTIASGVASNMISSLFGSNISASGSTINSIANTVAGSIAKSYETSSAANAAYSSLTSNSSSNLGIISSVAKSYADSVATSLTSMSTSSNSTTISTIASGMIASLFNSGSSSTDNTIARVANSVADSYLTNDIRNKYVSDDNSVVASAINWVNSNSEAVTSNISSLASEKTKVRSLAIQAYSVKTSELNQINSAIGNKSNVNTNYSNAKQAMSQATDAANDAVKDAQIIQNEINNNKKNINTNTNSIGNINQQLSNYANVSADATSAMSSLDTDNSALSWLVNSLGSVESEAPQASSNAAWISNNSASVSSLSNEWSSVNAQISNDSEALSQAIDKKANTSDVNTKYKALSGDIITASGIATKASDLANTNKESISKDSTAISNLQNKVNSDETEYSSVSANASNALTSLTNEDSRISNNANWISSNSGSVASLKNEFSSVNNQFGTDEKVLNTNINTKATNSDLTKDYNQLINDINKASGIASNAQSLANNNTQSITTNSNWIKNNSGNVSNTAVEANSAESSASNALKQLEDMSGLKPSDITSLSNAISNANNQISKDSSALSYAVQAKANDDKLANDYKNLNNDISHMNNMVNSSTFNSLANKVTENNKQINSLANKPTPTPISNPTTDYSGLDSLTSEINDNSQAISSLANKPTSSATINTNYLDELVNSGIAKLSDEVNAKFDNNNNQPTKTIKAPKVHHNNHKFSEWIMISKPLALHTKATTVGTRHNVAKVLKPNHKITLIVRNVVKVHHNYVLEIKYKHHNYFITTNHKYVANAYLPVNRKLIGKRVRVLHYAYEYNHITSGKVRTLHKGFTAKIKRVVKIGHYNMTRLQLSNGKWITANQNYIKLV